MAKAKKTAAKSAKKAAKADKKTAKKAALSPKATAKKAAKKPVKAAKPRIPPIMLSVLKPSVNNMSVRVFTRAAKLPFLEADVWGSTRSSEFLGKNPAHLTPMIEEKGLPRGALWESCAIMQYLSNKHGLEKFYPRNPAKRAMIDSAMFYLIGTFYPYVTRATYPMLGFPQYAGEVGSSDLAPEIKAVAQKAAMDALAEPLDVFHKFYMAGQPFIGGKYPSIADIRLASTLEFLNVIDYPLPGWAKDYIDAMEKKLGAAYAEPAADVRGYIGYVKSKTAAAA